MKFSLYKTILLLMSTLFLIGCEVGIDSLEYDNDSQVVSVMTAGNKQYTTTNDTIVISNIPNQIKNNEIRLELSGEEAKSFEGRFKREGQTLTIAIRPKLEFDVNIDRNITLIARVFIRGKPSCEYTIVKIFKVKKPKPTKDIIPTVGDIVSETMEDITAPNITLNCSPNITLTIGETYVEKNATAIDNVDGNVDIVITGNVNTSYEGNNTITYTAKDNAGNVATEIRRVMVIATVNQVPDTIPPVITINGESNITILRNTIYTDAGAKANDDRDGLISIATSNNVNTSKVGTYAVIYGASDNAKNAATNVIRYVTVIDPKRNKLIRWCNGANDITLWRTDGTKEGTVKVVGEKGRKVKKPSNFVRIGDLTYFSAQKSETNTTRVLWESDGSTFGTRVVNNTVLSVTELTNICGILFFIGNEHDNTKVNQVYKLNADETISIINIETTNKDKFAYRKPNMLTKVGKLLFFVVQEDDSVLKRLVRLDTFSDTALVGSNEHDDILEIMDVNKKLYYVNLNGAKVAIIAGINKSEKILKEFSVDRVPKNLYDHNGTLIFFVVGELWRSDGTVDGTFMIEDYRKVTAIERTLSNLKKFTSIGRRLYFNAIDADGDFNDKLRYIDGNVDTMTKTTIGTVQIQTLTNSNIYNTREIFNLDDNLLVVEEGDGMTYIWNVYGGDTAQIATFLTTKSIHFYDKLNNGVLFKRTDNNGMEELLITDGKNVTSITSGCSLW